jgi:hypothetical protein
VILDPINDTECLDQLTMIARELAPTTLIRSVATHLGSREAVIRWLQSLPQANDDGDEHVRFIQCDVPQRTRLLPDDPNCVERSMAALMLLEVIDPKTLRALATVERPLRHTGLVERCGTRWRAVDLFPRRNTRNAINVGEFGKAALQGTHQYVGKPILKFYLGDTGGQVADAIGSQENQWIGRDKKKQSEKKNTPPSAVAQQPSAPVQQQPVAAAQSVSAARLVGAGANQAQSAPAGGGGKNAQETKGASGPSVAAGDGAAASGSGQAADGDGGDSYDEGEAQERRWWFLG